MREVIEGGEMEPDVRRITDEEVLQVVRSNLPGVRNAEQIALDSDLWDAGMDSLANIAVMVAIEDTFGVEFVLETLTPETFSTVSTIADAVRGLPPAHAGTPELAAAPEALGSGAGPRDF